MVYNIASLYSHIAFKQPLKDTNGIKRAYNYFQKSAGCFRYMIDELLPQLKRIPPLDLDNSTLEALYYLSLAQAQEAFWLKAKSDNLKNSLIARLATQVSEYYSQTLEFANQTTAIRSEWIHHFACKKYHFRAAAQYRAALDCLDKSKYGEEIGHLKDSLEASSIALANAKYVNASVLEDLKDLHSRVKTDLVGAEKDNDMVYLQVVPTSASLPVITPISMATATVPEEISNPLEYLTVTRRIRPLFADILPYTIYEANNAYSEKINEYVHKNLISKVEEMTVNMHTKLQQLNLPGSLEAVEKPMGVPQSLILHSDEIRTKGGVSLLRGTVNDIQKLFRESMHLLEEGKEMLDYEDKEDAMMRGRQGTNLWVRAPSREAGGELWKAGNTFMGYLESSEASDKLVRDKFHKVERYLDILCEGPKKLETYIPNSAVVHIDPYLEYNVQELREALLQTRGIEDQRQKHMSSLMYTVANMDMLPEIITIYNGLVQGSDAHAHVDAAKFESVYTKHVNKLQKESDGWLEQQDAEQHAILGKIEELNERFLEIRESDSTTVERENAIQNLEVAYFKFGEIMQNLDEGRKFYNSLIDQLQRFKDQCKEFVYERRVEGRELENSISATFSQLSVNGSGYSDDDDEEEDEENAVIGGKRQERGEGTGQGIGQGSGQGRKSLGHTSLSEEEEEETRLSPQQPIAAPQARHAASSMIVDLDNKVMNSKSRVWNAGDDIKFSVDTKSSSGLKSLKSLKSQKAGTFGEKPSAWLPEYGIRFSSSSGTGSGTGSGSGSGTGKGA